jgi:hypothetical protein
MLFTSSDAERLDAQRLGAHHIVDSRDTAAMTEAGGSLDLIISTVDVPLDWAAILSTLTAARFTPRIEIKRKSGARPRLSSAGSATRGRASLSAVGSSKKWTARSQGADRYKKGGHMAFGSRVCAAITSISALVSAAFSGWSPHLAKTLSRFMRGRVASRSCSARWPARRFAYKRRSLLWR